MTGAAVKTAIDNAPATDGWPEPQSLLASIASKPYPIDALPQTMREAVLEVQGFTKAPVSLVASSALAALSVAAQSHVDVKRAEKLSGPVGLFLLTIADSGERKSTCDGFFTSPVREYEREQAEKIKPDIAKFKAEIDAWESQRAGILDFIKRASQKDKAGDVSAGKTRLEGIEARKPKPPRVPKLVRGDDTPENLSWALAREWPSAGVLSSEAGLILGAHAMGKDSIMRNLGLLNTLWDGNELPIGRRTSESFTVRGARLTVGLQVQEATLRSFFDRSGRLARGTGFLSRFLLACPESTQGSRFFSEAPAAWPALVSFHRRIAYLLAKPAPLDDDGTLNPVQLSLTAEAKKSWVTFHDSIEIELRNGGELQDVRDVASKTADNAVRLAALFHVLENGTDGTIGKESFEKAGQVAAWHLHEARRFFGELALPDEMADAVRLDEWLLTFCRKHGKDTISRREIQRNVTPAHLRISDRLAGALRELDGAGRIREITEDKRKDIQINPALLTVERA